MRNSDLTEGSASAAKVALMFSWNCRKYYPEGAQEWSQEMLGWSRVLLRQHIPFDIPIVEQTRSASDLEKYDLVILPNLQYLSDAFCAALAEYVRAGGQRAGYRRQFARHRKGFAADGVRARKLARDRAQGLVHTATSQSRLRKSQFPLGQVAAGARDRHGRGAHDIAGSCRVGEGLPGSHADGPG